MGQNILKILLGIIAFLILIIIIYFIIKYFCAVEKWELDYNANIADVMNIFVTIILAILVSSFFSRRQSVEKFEKELLISDLKEIESKVKILQNNYEKNEELSLSLVSVELNTVKTYIDRFEKTFSLYQHAPLLNQLTGLHYELYTKMTSFDSDIINTRQININEIQNSCNKFILETRNCMWKINNM